MFIDFAFESSKNTRNLNWKTLKGFWHFKYFLYEVCVDVLAAVFQHCRAVN